MVQGTDNPDVLCWSKDAKGRFNTKAAYELDWAPEEMKEESSNWGRIWKLKGPARWQFLLWIIRHGKLLTRGEGQKGDECGYTMSNMQKEY